MFGRVPSLPADVLFESVLRDDTEISFPHFIKEQRNYLHEVMIVAEKHSNDEQKWQANIYNKRVKGVQIEIGDRVLVANKAERAR